MAHLFISYSRSDKEYAGRLAAHLSEAGVEVWIDEGEIEPGARYRRTIRRAIDSCDAFLVIMTPAAEESRWVENELDWAEQQGKPVFTLLLEGGAWFGLTATHYEDVSGGRMPSLRFLDALPASTRLRAGPLRRPGSILFPARSAPAPKPPELVSVRPTASMATMIEGRAALTLTASASGQVADCAVAPDGSYIVSASTDRTLRLWDPVTGTVIRTLSGHSDDVRCCAVAPNGDYVVSGGLDQTLRVWNPDTGYSLRALTGHSGGVFSCVVAPSGRFILSASTDGAVRMWDPVTGASVGSYEGPTFSALRASAVAPGDAFVVSTAVFAGPGEPTVHVWDPRTCAALRTIRTGLVAACAVGPGGSYIVAAHGDGTLTLWDPATGAAIRTLRAPGRASPVMSCAVAPDGSYIVSGAADGLLRLWDPFTGAVIRTLEGHAGPVSCCAVAPDGSFIVSGSSELPGTVRVWR